MDHKYSDLLKKNSIMPTKQRLEIADIIFKKHQHFTANELIDRISLKTFSKITLGGCFVEAVNETILISRENTNKVKVL